MTFAAVLTLCVIVGVFALLATDRFSAELILVGGVVVLLLAGVLTPRTAFAGFANPGVVALAGLYIVMGALRETGAFDGPAHRLLRSARTVPSARRRLSWVTAPLSAFFNNTPIVALLMPIAASWARRRDQSVRGLLLPLSYAAVLGGTCTLIGTATHMVVHGLLLDHGQPGLGMFELLPIGLPVVLVGVPLTGWLAQRLLRDDRDTPTERAARAFIGALRVTSGAEWIGQPLEDTGLLSLQGTTLLRIDRRGGTLPAVPGLRVAVDDVLVFAGDRATLSDLHQRRGLSATDGPSGVGWALHEAVISRGSRLEGRRLADIGFRARYQAAVVAIHRRGAPMAARLEQVRLRHGDTLLIQAAPGFAATYRDAPEFYLVTELPGARRPRHDRAPVAALTLAGVVLAVALLGVPMATAAVTGALVVVAGGCLSPGAARRSVELSVLTVIASALALAHALEQTGLAAMAAEAVLGAATGLSPLALLTVVYLSGMVLTELITNTAAAALVLPFALALADGAHLDPRPFALATTISAAISLATPLGYQTNMMVYGPGGYRFRDFLKVGVPVQLACAATALTALAVRYGLGWG